MNIQELRNKAICARHFSAYGNVNLNFSIANRCKSFYLLVPDRCLPNPSLEASLVEYLSITEEASTTCVEDTGLYVTSHSTAPTPHEEDLEGQSHLGEFTLLEIIKKKLSTEASNIKNSTAITPALLKTSSDNNSSLDMHSRQSSEDEEDNWELNNCKDIEIEHEIVHRHDMEEARPQSLLIETTQTSDAHTRSTSSVCRICSKVVQDLLGIFSDKGYEQSLLQKINSILPIEVTAEDYLPTEVCLNCVHKLEIAHELKKTCAVADLALRLMFSNNQTVASSDEMIHSSPVGQSDMVGELMDIQPPPSSDTDKKIVENIQLSRFLCHICNIDCLEPNGFKCHINIVHNVPFIYECKMCLIFFSSNERLRDHNLELHKKELCNNDLQNTELCTAGPQNAELRLAERIARKKESRRKWRMKRLMSKPVLTHRKCDYCEMQLEIGNHSDNKKHKAMHYTKIQAQKILDSTIQCEKCNCKFLTEKSKSYHMVTVHKDRSQFICEYCGKIYHCRKNYLLHLEQHENPDKSLLCDLCGKSCSNKRNLYSHSRTHETKKCFICLKEVKAMKRHINFYHYKDRKIRCSLCGHSFFTEKELEEHKLCHENSQYECYICGNLFKNVENFFSHTQSHQTSLSKHLICPAKLCRTQLTSAEDFIRHCDGHSNEDFQVPHISGKRSDKIDTLLCSFCDQSFRHLKVYLGHLKMHGEGVSICCNICQKSFDNENSLTEHLETHPEAFDFNCLHCKQVFVTDKQRSDHEITIHQGGHQCDVCHKIISCKDMFDHHKTTHYPANIIPRLSHACQLCGKRYTKKGSLRKHMLLHSSDDSDELFTCHICGRKYLRRNKLKLHLSTHVQDNKLCD